MRIDPGRFDGLHNVLRGIVVPRPIAWVATVSPTGVPNLAPFSFFNVVAYRPPTVMFSSSRRNAAGAAKDTLANVEATGEFVVNVVTEPLAAAMNASAGEYPPEVDEFEVAGVTPARCERVAAPRVAEAPIAMECRLERVIAIGSGDDEHGMVLGTIELIHVDDALIDGYRIDHAALRAVGRLAGDRYCRTTDTFSLPRPGRPDARSPRRT